MKKLAVIVPCYNEELVISESYRRTKEALQSVPIATEIIYINDGSRDKTRELLDGIAASDPQVKVIHFSRNFGHQPAVTAGINNCDADLAVILDADAGPSRTDSRYIGIAGKRACKRSLLRTKIEGRGKLFQKNYLKSILPFA